MDRTAVYVLSCNRPELLACTLAGLCGYNGVKPTVVDDCSDRPAVARVLDAYQSAGLIERVLRPPAHGGVGVIRRLMLDDFLASDADQIVQVEDDILVGPGQVAALLEAWHGIRAAGHPVAFLNTMLQWWCRKVHSVEQFGPYRVALTMGGSEPLWTCDRQSIADNIELIPASRPDMVIWLNKRGGATLLAPEIQAQHIGAGPQSLYYPTFPWQNVVFRNENEKLRDSGPLRRPYPASPADMHKFVMGYPASALALYAALVAGSQAKVLPPYPAHAQAGKPEFVYLDEYHFFDPALVRVGRPTFVEVGVFTGGKLRKFMGRYPSAKAALFEPEPVNYAKLLRETTPSPSPHGAVQRINAALGEQDGPLPFYVYDHEQKHSTLPKHLSEQAGFYPLHRTLQVKGLGPLSLLRSTGFGEIDCLLMNCEGAERYLFEQLETEPALRGMVRQFCTSFHCDHCRAYPVAVRQRAMRELGRWYDIIPGAFKAIPYYLWRRRDLL